MAFRELLFISTRAPGAHKLRSTLTMLGLSVGVAPGGHGLIQTLFTFVGGTTGLNPPQTILPPAQPDPGGPGVSVRLTPRLNLSRRDDHLVSEHATTAHTLET